MQPPPAMYTSKMQLSLSGTMRQSSQEIWVPVLVPVFLSSKVSTALWRSRPSRVALAKAPGVLSTLYPTSVAATADGRYVYAPTRATPP